MFLHKIIISSQLTLIKHINKDYSSKKWKNGKNVQKKLPREIRSVWNTKPSIHLFKTGNSVVYSEPKDAATTELGKICQNHFG